MSDEPSLSIVVTSYTAERLGDIIELLDSIRAQDYPGIEIVYVVERSEPLHDRISEYVRDNGVEGARIILSQERLGLSGARNLGIKEATGEIIAFVDDDVVLFSDWAEEIVGAFQQDSVIGVTGPGFPKWEDENMAWLPEELHWIVSCTTFTGWDGERPVRTAWGIIDRGTGWVNDSPRFQVNDKGNSFFLGSELKQMLDAAIPAMENELVIVRILYDFLLNKWGSNECQFCHASRL